MSLSQSIGETLTIPSHIDATPCAVEPARLVFTDPALDPDPNVWVTLDDADKHDVAMDKYHAQQRAKNICASCPLLDQCRTWANRVQVFGVAGGLTEAERTGRYDAVDRYLREGEFPSQDELVAVWLAKGAQMTWIAEKYGIALSEVQRIRDLTRRGEAAQVAARVEARTHRRFERTSQITAVMYDLLTSPDYAGCGIAKADLVERMIQMVPADQAEANAAANRRYSSDTARRRAGAGRYVHNTLRIAARNGNITVDGSGTVQMDPELADMWMEYRSAMTSQAC